MAVQILYTYDKAGGGAVVGDLFAISERLAWSKKRNAVDAISFSMSLRKLAEWCESRNFDIARFFTPIKSSVVIVARDGTPIIGGFLASTPEFSFSQNPDSIVQFNFVGWLGIATGYNLKPVISYNEALNSQLVKGVNLALEAANAKGAPWPISVGTHLDTLATVQNTVDSPKKLADFLTERTDNLDGAGPFDIYFRENGQFEIWKNLGTDISRETTISWPDRGQVGGAKALEFPAWENYYSDIFLTGSGNGYGDGGGAITSTKTNTDTVANTGFYELATSLSSISDQDTLDSRATSYLRYTATPFSTPKATIDAEQFKIYDHRYGGNLWIGDTLAVDVSSGLAKLLPIEQFAKFRVDSIDVSYDKQGRGVAVLNFIDPTGGTNIS